MQSNEPAKILFEIKDIRNDLSERSASICLPNNDKVKFTLTCNPDVDWNDGKYTMVFLRLASSNKEQVSILYRFSIVTYGENLKVQEGDETFFNRFPRKHGVVYPIEQNILLDSANSLVRREYVNLKNCIDRSKIRFIQNLKICCEIKEVENNEINKTPEDDSFIQNMQTLLKTGKYSDAILFVGGKELRVHKNILASRSKVFSAMFEHECEEKSQNRVEITDIQLDVCEELLRYIYTGKIESMDKLAVELLVVSDKYGLKELKDECEAYLEENLSIETVADILLLADLHQASELKEECIDFISENGIKVKSTRGWKTLATKADLATELFLKLADKYEKITNPVPKKKIIFPKTEQCEIYSNIQLLQDFGSLIANEKFSDATFILEDGELRVHRNILAVRSPVFAANFEQEKDRIELPDIGVELCKQLLHYIYANGEGDFSLDKEYENEFLMLSVKYQLNGLKIRSEIMLSYGIKIESVSIKLILANKHNASYLTEKCFEFITKNCRQVTQTEEWKILAKTKPELVVQLYERNAAKHWC